MTENNSDSKQYKGIFQTTFLFGFVQVFKTVLGVIVNKVAAIFLGAEGLGVLGIFYSALGFIQTGSGFGVSQSAVRDISQAYEKQNSFDFSKIILVTKKIVHFTGLLGCIITVVLSPWLSELMLGNNNYTLSFLALSLVACFNIMTEGQLAILKGMRKMRALANATMVGSISGVVTAIPLYYFLGMEGIVLQLLIASAGALFITSRFVNRIEYNKIKLSVKETLIHAKPMLQMGTAMMLVGLLSTIISLVILSYIRSHGGLKDVGFFNAGSIILNSYFGVLITALLTDYYPRIAAINQDNNKLQKELNNQLIVTMVLTIPLFVVFIFLMPLMVEILFSKEFYPTIDYLKMGIYGTLITLFSNQFDLILVAKFKIRIFSSIAIMIKAVQLGLAIILYKQLGLIGLGIGATAYGFLHMLIMTIVIYRLYKISVNRFFLKLSTVFILFIISASISSNINNVVVKYSIGIILTLTSFTTSYIISKNYLGFSIVEIVINKFKK